MKTVPRIKKSFTWLYFALPDLLGDVGGDCGEVAAGGAVAGSCCRAGIAPNGVRNTTVQKITIHRQRNYFLLATLNGRARTLRCQESGPFLLFLIIFFVFLVIILVDEVAILARLAFLFFIVLFVQVVGDDV